MDLFRNTSARIAGAPLQVRPRIITPYEQPMATAGFVEDVREVTPLLDVRRRPKDEAADARSAESPRIPKTPPTESVESPQIPKTTPIESVETSDEDRRSVPVAAAPVRSRSVKTHAEKAGARVAKADEPKGIDEDAAEATHRSSPPMSAIEAVGKARRAKNARGEPVRAMKTREKAKRAKNARHELAGAVEALEVRDAPRAALAELRDEQTVSPPPADRRETAAIAQKTQRSGVDSPRQPHLTIPIASAPTESAVSYAAPEPMKSVANGAIRVADPPFATTVVKKTLVDIRIGQIEINATQPKRPERRSRKNTQHSRLSVDEMMQRRGSRE